MTHVRLCLLRLALPGRVPGLVRSDSLLILEELRLPGFRVQQHLELQRIMGGMLRRIVSTRRGGVRGRDRVVGMAVRMAIRLVPTVQFPHWPFRLSPTDIGSRH